MNEKMTMGLGRPFPPLLPDLEDYIVDFDGPDDPMHPYNWELPTKYGKCYYILGKEHC